MESKMSSIASLGKLPGKKIDSPLAKYNSAGQLYCVLCNTQVKNEIYWTGHINGKSHREQLSSLKSKNNNKREINEEKPSTPSKRVKFEDDSDFAVPLPPPFKAPSKPTEPLNLHNFASVQERISKENAAFDENMEEADESKHSTVPDSKTTLDKSQLPEGFFDDPKEDAKARGIEYRDPEEVEWEKFVKEIASEEIRSTALRSVDEEESTYSRDLKEIEEQMAHWQRVIELEKRAQEAKQQQSKKSESLTNMTEEDDEEIDYDEDLDWRSKKH